MAEVQVPPTIADEYYGDPADSSLKYGSEMHIGKSGTDVLLIGSAWAAGKRPVTRMQVTMSVAGRQKTILVTGDRVWQGWTAVRVRSHSSRCRWSGNVRSAASIGTARRCWLRSAIRSDADSPAGDPPADMQGLAVPNLEDPAAPLQQVGQVPSPACFAPIAPSWLPRRAYAGTYDERWQRARAPYLPDDFDPRFFQCAAPEFAFDRYLQAGEPVQVAGVMPDGPIAFTVPDSHLNVAVTVAGATQTAAGRTSRRCRSSPTRTARASPGARRCRAIGRR